MLALQLTLRSPLDPSRREPFRQRPNALGVSCASETFATANRRSGKPIQTKSWPGMRFAANGLGKLASRAMEGQYQANDPEIPAISCDTQ